MQNSIECVHHVGIIVSDMDRMLYFYRDIVGFEVQADYICSGTMVDKATCLQDVEQRVVFFKVGNGETLFELLEYRSPKGRDQGVKIENNDVGIRHIAIQVSDTWRLYKALRLQNVKFLSEPQTVPEGHIIVYFYDPEGNIIEFFQPSSL